jgi:hypothetical protein
VLYCVRRTTCGSSVGGVGTCYGPASAQHGIATAYYSRQVETNRIGPEGRESDDNNVEKPIEMRHNELALPMVRDMVNGLAVIVGHCDLLRDQIEAESQCAKRIYAIREIAQGLNLYQCQVVESARTAERQKRGVA